MNILWLCSWYPNKIKPFDGDFIQRHSYAVSILHQVQVIHVVKDDKGKMAQRVTKETTTDGNLTETIIYYQQRNIGIHFLDKIRSASTYRRLYKKAISSYLEKCKDVKLVHVHVAMKAGTMALWLKKKYGLPYILSEHWTGYLEQARPNFEELNWLIKSWIKKIFKQAAKVTSVSESLAHEIRKRFDVTSISIIPNVVDTRIFYPLSKPENNKVEFIHVSTMTYQKNIEQILSACSIVKKINPAFVLNVFVPSGAKLHDMILTYGLEGFVQVNEEVPQSVLASRMQKADALILYSRYETFGCVVIEANACGLPAILSNLAVFKEYSVESETALFVPLDNEQLLADTMIHFMNKEFTFNAEEISRRTHGLFNYNDVAKKFDTLYKEINLPLISQS